jgi:hypothetical protein
VEPDRAAPEIAEEEPVTTSLEPSSPGLAVLGHRFLDEDYGATIGYGLAQEYRAEHVDLDAWGWPPAAEPVATAAE